jgi:hypothetical protein
MCVIRVELKRVMMGSHKRVIVAGPIIVLVVAIFVLLSIDRGAAEVRRRVLVHDPLSHRNEDDIRETFLILIDDSVASGGDAGLACEKIYEIAKKLEDGWEGFVVDRYYPSGYTSHQLLAELYWELAARVSSNSENACLERLLGDVSPLGTGNDFLIDAYEYAMERHGL